MTWTQEIHKIKSKSKTVLCCVFPLEYVSYYYYYYNLQLFLAVVFAVINEFNEKHWWKCEIPIIPIFSFFLWMFEWNVYRVFGRQVSTQPQFDLFWRNGCRKWPSVVIKNENSKNYYKKWISKIPKLKNWQKYEKDSKESSK